MGYGSKRGKILVCESLLRTEKAGAINLRHDKDKIPFCPTAVWNRLLFALLLLSASSLLLSIICKFVIRFLCSTPSSRLRSLRFFLLIGFFVV